MARRRKLIPAAVGFLLVALVTPIVGQQVAEVQVNPPTVTVGVGQEGGVFATAYDANGNVLVSQQFRWTSSDPNIVRVEFDASLSETAKLIGVAPGVARVEAHAGGRVGTAAVQVVGAGAQPVGGPPAGEGDATVVRIEPGNIEMLAAESRQLIPVFLKDDGSPAASTAVTWRSLNPTIVTVSEDGLVVANSEGQGTIELSTPQGLVQRAPVRVVNAPFGFNVPVVSLSPGGRTTLRVSVPSQGDRALAATSLSWRSSNTAVARVTPLGVVEAVTAGTAEIIAAGFLQERSVTVTVHRPVASLDVRPGPTRPVIAPFGGTVQFRVTALGADETPVLEAPLSWSVSDTSVAAFDPATQVLHGVTIGKTELHLVGPGPDILEATWQIEVVPGGLLATPGRVGIGVRDTVFIDAQLTDDTGAPISPAQQVTWTSSDTSVLVANPSGIATGVGVGHAQLVASTPWEAADTVDVYVQGSLLITATRGGSHDLYTVDPRTPGVWNRITDDPGIEVSGAVSPEGSRVAFISDRDGNLELYVANADGSDPRRLTTTDAREDQPSWSPDGRQIAYVVSAAGQRPQVWVISADGSNPRQLTRGDTANYEPAFSPDGSVIAFTTIRDQNYDIYLMDPDGSNQRNVTASPGKETHPQWVSEGAIAYIAEQASGGATTATVLRRDLASGDAVPLSPPGLSITDFAVSGDGRMLALQVSEFLPSGGISHRVLLVTVGQPGAPIEIPREGAADQHSGPSFRSRGP